MARTMALNVVALLSGGLDSMIVTEMALQKGRIVHPLLGDYGQRARKMEIKCAQRQVRHFEKKYPGQIAPLRVVKVDLNFGTSALTSHGMAIPRNKRITLKDGIPPTYVPGRNIVFLAIAGSYAEATSSAEIWTGIYAEPTAIGATKIYGSPDVLEPFLTAMGTALKRGLALEHRGLPPVKLLRPLQHTPKAKIIAMGAQMGVRMDLTYSCFTEGPHSCRTCATCLYRSDGFLDAGIVDRGP